MTSYDMAVAVNTVARAWAADGRGAPMAVSPASAAICSMPGCSGMPFVDLRTSLGPTSLCFSHFESVKADLSA